MEINKNIDTTKQDSNITENNISKTENQETHSKISSQKILSSEVRLDILKGFGADFDTETRENLIFVNRALCHPVGKHIILRNILSESDNMNNNELFIYLEKEVINISCLNVSKDNYLLLIACENLNNCDISIYNLSKLNFDSYIIYKPRRKIISTEFKKFKYCSFSEDGNFIATLGVTNQNEVKGVIYDINIFKNFKENNYSPKFIFNLNNNDVDKITFWDNKMLCTSGKGHLGFWFPFENTYKEYKSLANLQKNYVDHSWIYDSKTPLLAALTEDNDIYIFIPNYEKNKMYNNSNELIITKFSINQTISNIFKDNEFNNDERESNNKNLNKNNIIKSTRIQSFKDGLVVGNELGNILFIEKNSKNEYIPIRYTMREKEGSVTGLAFSSFTQDYLAVSFKTNEIAYLDLKDIFLNLKNEKFEINFNIICDGFHNGPITCMDVALQRPIIVTTSQKDKSIRLWNYLTGHCEYCKIILEEKNNLDEYELNILSVAIHPNGYYIAISDTEMIRFFHICYKQLRFYGNDQIGNEPTKGNCTMLKFSNGGHLLAAIQEKRLYLIRSYSRETVKTINTPHSSNIVSIFFHFNDNYVYTVGSEGFIIQYNLFDFNYIKISTKFNMYSSSLNYKSYLKQDKTNLIDNIISCGYQGKNYTITNVNFDAMKTEEEEQCVFTQGFIDKECSSICNINTKRFNVNSVAVGTETGEICLYSHDFSKNNNKDNNKKEKRLIQKFDEVKSHRNRVNCLYFHRDTNLLFSAGDDGNLFIYAIYEYFDGDPADLDDNKATELNQLNTILDEGLGDNVLINLNEIFEIKEKIKYEQKSIHKYQRQINELNKTFKTELTDKINSIKKIKDGEILDLKNSIENMKISNTAMIEDYDQRIEDIQNENRRKFNEREGIINEKLNELNNENTDLKNLNEKIKNDFEKALKNNNYDQLQKFKELEFYLSKKFNDLINSNKKIYDELKIQSSINDKKISIIEVEHEYEINENYEKFRKNILSLENEISKKKDENKKLSDKLEKLEQTSIQDRTNLKHFMEENERLLNIINNLRKQLDLNQQEKESIQLKLKQTEINLQEKSKIEGFSNKLKNELYKKNYEMTARFNSELELKDKLKDGTKKLEDNLENTINILINKEKEIKMQKLLIDDLKKQLENQRHNSLLVQKDIDNINKKIFTLVQSKDKNEIINGVRDIYKKFLSNYADKNFDTNNFNIDLKAEYEKQIEYLQNKVIQLNKLNNQNQNIDKNQFKKKLDENGILIEEMSKIRKLNIDLLKQISDLKYSNIGLKNEIKKLKNNNNIKQINESSIQNESNINNNNKNNISSINNNNISEISKNNNSSIPTIQSVNLTNNNIKNINEDLPLINKSISTMASVKKPAYNMKGFRNKIYNPSFNNERLMKYNQVKNIIIEKNQEIRMLTAENDYLKQTIDKKIINQRYYSPKSEFSLKTNISN